MAGVRSELAAFEVLDVRGVHSLLRRQLFKPSQKQTPAAATLDAAFHRIEMLVQQRRAWIFYHEALEAGLPIVPDISWSLWEPDGRLWAEWVNAEPDLRAVSIFCGGKRIHAERRAHRETVEDLALFHQAVRPEVAFVLGGVHSPRRLLDYRRAAPRRHLVVCNGQAYALAQRRRLLGGGRVGARSARECFLSNCDWNQAVYQDVLSQSGDALEVRPA